MTSVAEGTRNISNLETSRTLWQRINPVLIKDRFIGYLILALILIATAIPTCLCAVEIAGDESINSENSHRYDRHLDFLQAKRTFYTDCQAHTNDEKACWIAAEQKFGPDR